MTVFYFALSASIDPGKVWRSGPIMLHLEPTHGGCLQVPRQAAGTALTRSGRVVSRAVRPMR